MFDELQDIAGSQDVSDYESHEFAKIFPLMDDDALTSLVADIKVKGLKNEIVLFEGKILDGRNRKIACDLAGVIPRFRHFQGSRQDALGFVWSENRERRHLTSSQRAACQAKWVACNDSIVEALREDAKQRQREGGGDKKSDKAKSVTQKIGEPIKSHASETDAALAKLAGTNRQYMTVARTLAKENPSLLDDVAEGRVTMVNAAKQLKAEKQTEAKLCKQCGVRDAVKSGLCDRCYVERKLLDDKKINARCNRRTKKVPRLIAEARQLFKCIHKAIDDSAKCDDALRKLSHDRVESAKSLIEMCKGVIQ